MMIRPSSVLHNEYTQILELAKMSGEPIFITHSGKEDAVFMSTEAFEAQEKMYQHRDKIYLAEISRLNGEPTFTPEKMDKKMEALFDAYSV